MLDFPSGGNLRQYLPLANCAEISRLACEDKTQRSVWLYSANWLVVLRLLGSLLSVSCPASLATSLGRSLGCEVMCDNMKALTATLEGAQRLSKC